MKIARLKELCRAFRLDDSGKEKSQIIGRIIGARSSNSQPNVHVEAAKLTTSVSGDETIASTVSSTLTVKPHLGLSVDEFIAKWSKSEAAEQKNKDLFLIELCDLLGIGHPDAAGRIGAKDDFVFEKDVRIPDEGGTSSIGRIDLYKKGCFILEAKQGSTSAGKKIGTAKRKTSGWYMAMEEAFGQALKYAKHGDEPPPFLIICDIG